MKSFLLPLLLIIILLSGCNSAKRKSNDQVIFVSILPLKYFADQIVGETYKVEVTVPPGVGPETYSPIPRQMMSLGKAKAYFSVGYLGFEQAWLKSFESTNPQLRVFHIAEGIDLIRGEEQSEHHEGHEHIAGVDPHIWSSPKAASQIAKNICNGMIEIDPQKGDLFSKNLEKLLKDIAQVDSAITAMLTNIPSKEFIIFHPALGYFARDYGLEQHAIEFEGKVPSPKHLQDVIETAKAGNIKFVLIQKEFDQENAEIIAKETGSRIIQIDPLDYNWPEQMISIAEKLSAAH